MNYVKQFRYYGDGDERNHPSDLTFQKLIKSDFIINENLIEQYGDIKYLKIVSNFSGIEFNINEEKKNIIITPPNRFQLNSDNFITITSFKFINNIFLQRLKNKWNEKDFLIVDVVYNKEVKE